MHTGVRDKNGVIIKLGDTLRYTSRYIDFTECQRFEDPTDYTVCYGVGNYDSGVYTYIGWYLVDISGDDDGFGWILLEDNKCLEVVNS